MHQLLLLLFYKNFCDKFVVRTSTWQKCDENHDNASHLLNKKTSN